MTSCFRGLTLAEIIEELERPVSDTDLSDSDDGSHPQKDVISVFISPPSEHGEDTPEDSGDETHVNIGNVPGSQLNAEASCSSNINIGSTSAGDVTPDTQPVPRSTDRKRKKIREWCVNDLPSVADDVSYPYRPSSADVPCQPHEIFELFLDVTVIDLLFKHTTTYAVQKGDHSFTVDGNEMRVFIGILLASGYVSVPRRRMYWSNDSDVRNEMISNAMRRNRFDEIMKYLHAVDNLQIQKGDKFAKNTSAPRPFERALYEHWISVRAICRIYRRIHGALFWASLQQTVYKGKANTLGVQKLGCGSPKYAFHISVYQGKEKSPTMDAYKDFGVGGSVVMHFLDELETKYPLNKFFIYVDNYFTSFRLIEAVGERGHFLTGTVRSNRVENCKFQSVKNFSKAARGTEEHFLDGAGKFIVVRWNDNGVVTMASNAHGVNPMQRATRFSVRERRQVKIPMPSVVSMYNKRMGGVDRMDQNVACYRIGIRGKKWYFPLLAYLLNVAVQNAWIFASKGGYTGDLLAFTRAIVHTYLRSYGQPVQNPRRQEALARGVVPRGSRFDGVGHHIESTGERRRCVVCRSQTVHGCVKCRVRLHVKCFGVFHTE